MRISLIEIQQTEEHIFNGTELPAHISTADLQAQRQVYALVQEYGRKQLKKELEAVHTKLFSESAFYRFRRRIARYFR